MRVLQLIDSLTAGGAERMAVSYANELVEHVEASHLCTTRKEGLLKATLNKDVNYLFLNKKRTIDPAALRRLLQYVSRNKIDIIHAHSSSFFYASLVKVFNRNVKVIWHDHYGENEMLDARKYGVLKKASKYFDAVISVNENLRNWAETHLKCDKVNYLKNFVSKSINIEPAIELKGENTFCIVCLANIREQKDHLNLLSAFKIIKERGTNVSLHLLGEIHHDAYYKSLVAFISENNIEDVYFYDSQIGILNLLRKCDLGVLSSASEGLPVALLEYGLANLPVVCTDVGQCKEVLHNFGKLVPGKDSQLLSEAILDYFYNAASRKEDAANFSAYIEKEYAFNSILPKIMSIYNTGKY